MIGRIIGPYEVIAPIGKGGMGEVYDRNALTAAHRTLPFGTEVRVTNRTNGRSVRLRINDRGPFVDGRIIDVSRRAAEMLDFVNRGVVEVRVEVVAITSDGINGSDR